MELKEKTGQEGVVVYTVATKGPVYVVVDKDGSIVAEYGYKAIAQGRANSLNRLAKRLAELENSV